MKMKRGCKVRMRRCTQFNHNYKKKKLNYPQYKKKSMLLLYLLVLNP
jgi:hypothetical protein